LDDDFLSRVLLWEARPEAKATDIKQLHPVIEHVGSTHPGNLVANHSTVTR
jgi:hypothetical protein